MGPLHYARWMAAEHPEHLGSFYRVLDAELEVNAVGGGATGAPQVHDNPVPRDCYHTDWVADRVISLPLWRDMPTSAVATIAEALARLHSHADEVAAVRSSGEEVGACASS